MNHSQVAQLVRNGVISQDQADYSAAHRLPAMFPAFNAYVERRASHVDWFAVDADITDSFETLRGAFRVMGRLPINTGFSDKTIFGDPLVNWMFRAWHDMTHLRLGADFTLAGETSTAVGQIEDVRDARNRGEITPEQAEAFAAIIYVEVVAQAKLAIESGSFVSDQRAYMVSELGKGDFRL